MNYGKPLCALILSLAALAAAGQASAAAAPRIQILLVGVDHLGKKHDVHNSPNIDPLTPAHQAEIKEIIEDIQGDHRGHRPLQAHQGDGRARLPGREDPGRIPAVPAGEIHPGTERAASTPSRTSPSTTRA